MERWIGQPEECCDRELSNNCKRLLNYKKKNWPLINTITPAVKSKNKRQTIISIVL